MSTALKTIKNNIHPSTYTDLSSLTLGILMKTNFGFFYIEYKKQLDKFKIKVSQSLNFSRKFRMMETEICGPVPIPGQKLPTSFHIVFDVMFSCQKG